MAATLEPKDDPKSHLTVSGHATPRTAARPGTILEDFKNDGRPVIAIDMDDVLSQTNEVVAEWHNSAYGTSMTLDDFYYYYYWMNPYWGDPDETIRKVEEFWKTDYIDIAPPVAGAYDALLKLTEKGYRLVVVTARQLRELDRSIVWVEKNLPGLIDTFICTGQSMETLADQKELATKLSKADVCRKIGAKFLIDDSVENALKCVVADPPEPVLLFGDYSWNTRVGRYSDITKETSFEEKLKREGGREFWKEDSAALEKEIPPSAPLTRVKDWKEVLEWVEKKTAEGKL
ncbi:hypothetical protein BD310DRAFT_943733 [Dichomitus squalens]|uniref:HAD-like domain-containing protein n=1 Tax=Dichomitus squalens TaxID=114155 RepID=A0A4Q9QAX6_9APHY|nr:hypothetical protein BD310DRAFT_943733 [Dichomitus squalens]